MRITATYSPEDNKIRLYASQRLDQETYEKVKAAGFKWAPKQELYVAPMWTVAREDLAIELAGEIEAEESTMAERAEAKAERLEELAGKRRREANAFSKAAHQISERFAMGQPILVGHHSERRARKDRERMDNAMRKAIEADKAAGWWLYKATGAQAHANHKNKDSVRARRIKTLLAELRDLQRKLNHASLCLELWEKATEDETIRKFLGVHLKEGSVAPWELWGKVDKGEVSPQDARDQAIAMHERTLESENLKRWIEHTLNRLGYEREMLGEVPRFEGTVTPVMLQEFTREHGADSPKGEKTATGLKVTSLVPLPAHIGEGKALELTEDGWKDLMQACGYEAQAKAAKKAAKSAALPPLMNIKTTELKAKAKWRNGQIETYRVVEMTKEAYGKIRSEERGTRVSECGGFRFRICPDATHTGPYYSRPWVAAFLTDMKASPKPEASNEAEAA